VSRQAEAVDFYRKGVPAQDVAVIWQCSYFNAYSHLRAAEAAEGGRPWRGRGDGEALDKGVLAAVSEQIADLARDVRRVESALAALSTQSTEQVAALAEDLRRAMAMVAALSAQPARAAEAEAQAEIKPITATPPRELWAWLVVEAQREIGEAATAKSLGVDVLVMKQIVTGTRTPSSAVRDRLRELTATLWARELFGGMDEVEDAREALGRSKR